MPMPNNPLDADDKSVVQYYNQMVLSGIVGLLTICAISLYILVNDVQSRYLWVWHLVQLIVGTMMIARITQRVSLSIARKLNPVVRFWFEGKGLTRVVILFSVFYLMMVIGLGIPWEIRTVICIISTIVVSTLSNIRSMLLRANWYEKTRYMPKI